MPNGPARSKPRTAPSCATSKITFPEGARPTTAWCWRSMNSCPMRTGSRRKACRSGSTPGSSSPPRRRSRPAPMTARNSTDSIWVSPREALAGGESGRFKLPFPTTRNLIRLGKQPNVQAALDDSRGKAVVTVMPVMTKLNGGRQLRIPLEAGYDGEVFEVGSVVIRTPGLARGYRAERSNPASSCAQLDAALSQDVTRHVAYFVRTKYSGRPSCSVRLDSIESGTPTCKNAHPHHTQHRRRTGAAADCSRRCGAPPTASSSSALRRFRRSP